LIDWEPFDFGSRKSKVDLAESTRRRTEASVARTQFEAEAATADAYVTILAAQETVKAATASVERSRYC
jgi:outer membrane protein TolC